MYSIKVRILVIIFSLADQMGGDPIFLDNHCKGYFDKASFAKLEQVCNDCFNLYNEPLLYSYCSQACFSSPYFLACLEVLTLIEEQEIYEGYIGRIHAPSL